MGILEVIRAALETANRLMQRVWGDQTAAEASLIKQAEAAAAKKHDALAKLQEARNQGDADATARYLSAVNDWDAALRRLRDQAAAQRSERP